MGPNQIKLLRLMNEHSMLQKETPRISWTRGLMLMYLRRKHHICSTHCRCAFAAAQWSIAMAYQERPPRSGAIVRCHVPLLFGLPGTWPCRHPLLWSAFSRLGAEGPTCHPSSSSKLKNNPLPPDLYLSHKELAQKMLPSSPQCHLFMKPLHQAPSFPVGCLECFYSDHHDRK